MAAIYIYCLRDPRSGDVRYVGKTNNPKKRRVTHYAQSMLEHGRAKTKWVLELRSLGLRPELHVLETCDETTWRERERFWIAHYSGIRKLLNARLGGEIIPPRTKESYRAQGERMRGRPRPPEVLAKMSKSLKGHNVSESAKQKIREANRIQFADPEKREQHRQAVKNWWTNLTPEKRAKCLEGAAQGRRNRLAKINGTKKENAGQG
jgi:hypothetical protein